MDPVGENCPNGAFLAGRFGRTKTHVVLDGSVVAPVVPGSVQVNIDPPHFRLNGGLLPASSASTVKLATSVSRLAKTPPALPVPTMMKSKSPSTENNFLCILAFASGIFMEMPLGKTIRSSLQPGAFPRAVARNPSVLSAFELMWTRTLFDGSLPQTINQIRLVP